MLDLQRVTILAGLALLAFACGKEFTAADAPAGGAAGQAAGGAGAASGSAIGGDGDGVPDGGVETDGGAPLGGSVSGGRGGARNVSGGGNANEGGSNVAGSGGSGGSVVEVPALPLEGLEVWLDAKTGVTETNGVVSTWKDRSGHQRDAQQTAVNYRPKLDLSGLKGKPAVVFAGDDYLKLPSLPGNFSHGVSVFAVVQPDSDICAGIFEASNGSEVDDVHLGIWENALQYEVANEYLSASTYPLTFGVPQLLAAVHQTSNSVQARRNSNGLGEANFALPATIERQSVYIGRTDYSGCGLFTGTIAELIVYSRAVSDEELVNVESYLKQKWNCCSE